MNNLFIIGNERISYTDNYFYSENIEFKSLAEELKNKFNLEIFARNSSKKQNFLIDFLNIKLSTNILVYLFKIAFSCTKKNSTYLIVSITPFTFLAYLILIIFSNRIFLYLRSDGFKEYESILGKKWVFIYGLMINVMVRKSEIISCVSIPNIYNNKKFHYIKPSELDHEWFADRKNPNFLKINLLYVGRVKIEKGIFDLVNLLKEINDINYTLTIVGGNPESIFLENENITHLRFVDSKKELIKLYDNHNIFILPSFTEAHPKVLDESLSRLRPVIIFNEIKHIIQDRKGVFAIKRDSEELKKLLNYIIENKDLIVLDMLKNKLPTKNLFFDDLNKILKSQ
jgi:glycosyltransferase involved in cell wall biosynthesis